MSKSNNYPSRVQFQKGKQNLFILTAQERLRLSSEELAFMLKLHPRTVRDWRREKFCMSLHAVQFLCKKANMSFPDNAKVKDPFWYAATGGVKAWAVLRKKYKTFPMGDQEHRKQKWREWWEREGQYKNNLMVVKIPRFSFELAEFVGIMMGDGGLTPSQLKITLNRIDDKLYTDFVVILVEKLFGVKPSVTPREMVYSIMVSRRKLIQFCQDIGLKVGNKIKQRIDIPLWVKNKKPYLIACVRGLMDTDGCIYNECHMIGGKQYCYPRLSFVSHSPPLRESVWQALSDFGFKPKIRNSRSVHLEKRQDIIDYFRIVGTNNPKHRKRYQRFLFRD
ncbi:MAG: hypothetical protein HYZ63_04170 [Candidatus Andersenbacteria bacterium]|nr:hypothetical protein [Candidatus Andersenbacteria bacterium]